MKDQYRYTHNNEDKKYNYVCSTNVPSLSSMCVNVFVCHLFVTTVIFNPLFKYIYM